MNLHINWDDAQTNGIVFNATYTNGALYTGLENRPKVSFSYKELSYTEVFERLPNTVKEENGSVRPMTPIEEEEIRQLITGWVQPYGQEGNPVIDPVEVAVANGVYQKHVDRTGGDLNSFRGLSYIDDTYNVMYKRTGTLSDIESERTTGTKLYLSNASNVPELVSQFGITPHLSADLGDSQEYYLECDTYEQVEHIATTLGLPLPYTEEQRMLIETKAYIYRPKLGGIFNISINLLYGMPTHLVGFIRMPKEEVGTMFSIDVDSYVVPPLPIFEITARQLRLVLLAHGKLADVVTAIASLPEGAREKAEIEWEYATTIKRYNETFSALALALGFTEASITDLFLEASVL